MKKVLLSAITIMALSSVSTAGKNVAPVLSEVEPIVEATPKIENNGVYVGIGYSKLTRDNKEVMGNFDNKDVIRTSQNILASIGYKYSDYIAIEGRYWFDVNGYESKIADIYFEKYDDVSTYGIYLKPMYTVPLTEDRLVAYALLGYAKHSFTKESEYIGVTKTSTVEVDANGFSFGAGLQFVLTSHLSMSLDGVVFQTGYDYDEVYTAMKSSAMSSPLYTESDIYTINMMISYTF